MGATGGRGLHARMDSLGERWTRRLAGGLSRRHLLSRLGAWAAAAPALPLLPVARAHAQATAGGQPIPPSAAASAFVRNAQTRDDRACDYWRYCAIDGQLCTCCGGGVHTCPPGTQPSPTAWIGTCVNPDDGRSYLVAYRDCCGTSACRSKCDCLASERETPPYRPQTNNDIIWCIGLNTMQYHCSTSTLVGLAE